MIVGEPHWYGSNKRRPFVSVYDGGSQMLGEYVAAYTPEQRVYRENKIARGVGHKPIYRINVRFHRDGDRHTRAAAKQFAIYEETLAQARAEGRVADYAYSYKQGCVAPDGAIWLTPTSRAQSGVVQLTVEEAAKAEHFGWTETGSPTPGYRHMSRA